MTDAASEKKIARLTPTRDFWAGSKFCLAMMTGYETDEPKTEEKKQDMIEGVSRVYIRSSRVIQACNMGGCTLRITKSLEHGTKVRGVCRASEFCMKESFEAVDDAPTVEEGRVLYGDIIKSTDGFASKHSAGNFCPKLNCSLSAGVSIDGNPGTAGVCIKETMLTPQLQLEVDS